MITAYYAAFLALWLSFLFLNVVAKRRKHLIGLGDGENEDLLKAIRIHANFTETVPYILILMILLEMMNYNLLMIHALGSLLILSRMLHFIGISKSSGVSTQRFLAGIITNSLLVIGAVMLLIKPVLS